MRGAALLLVTLAIELRWSCDAFSAQNRFYWPPAEANTAKSSSPASSGTGPAPAALPVAEERDAPNAVDPLKSTATAPVPSYWPPSFAMSKVGTASRVSEAAESSSPTDDSPETSLPVPGLVPEPAAPASTSPVASYWPGDVWLRQGKKTAPATAAALPRTNSAPGLVPKAADAPGATAGGVAPFDDADAEMQAKKEAAAEEHRKIVDYALGGGGGSSSGGGDGSSGGSSGRTSPLQEALAQQKAVPKARSTRPLFQFDDANRDAALSMWERVDDVIMGGISSSSLARLSEAESPVNHREAVLFRGIVREEGGGFCGQRTKLLKTPLDLSAYDGVYIKCLADNDDVDRRVWKMSLRTKADRGEVIYSTELPTLPRRPGTSPLASSSSSASSYTSSAGSSKLATAMAEKAAALAPTDFVYVPFSAFQLVRGPRLVVGAPPVDASNVFQMSITCTKFRIAENTTTLPDFKAGLFRLEISEIGVFSDDVRPADFTPWGSSPTSSAAAAAAAVALPSTEDNEERRKSRPLALRLLSPLSAFVFSERDRRRGLAFRKLSTATVAAKARIAATEAAVAATKQREEEEAGGGGAAAATAAAGVATAAAAKKLRAVVGTAKGTAAAALICLWTVVTARAANLAWGWRFKVATYAAARRRARDPSFADPSVFDPKHEYAAASASSASSSSSSSASSSSSSSEWRRVASAYRTLATRTARSLRWRVTRVAPPALRALGALATQTGRDALRLALALPLRLAFRTIFWALGTTKKVEKWWQERSQVGQELKLPKLE